MTTERNYTGLNLDRNLITSVIDRFVTENTLAIREQGNRPGGEGTRIVIGRVGIEDATVDIYFNRDGTSTLQWKMGKNRELGLALSDALYDTINPDEFQSVNMTIIGVARNDIQSIIELIPTDDNLIFEVAEEPIAAGIRWRIRCQNHGDTLTVTHYTSRKLQIQGRPLSSYRKLVYLLTDILDLVGLEMVLSRQDESVTEIVRQDVAAEFLKKMLPNSYGNLPDITRKLLVSGQCVKLAGPALPEYSMLLFPELRSLEGALKAKLAECGFDSNQHDFGYFFERQADKSFQLKASFNGHITEIQLRSTLSDAYTFFHKHRHGLFHMDSFAESSRKITVLQQLLSLSETAYEHIDKLYQ